MDNQSHISLNRSSLADELLLNKASSHEQEHWILPYLDVFILLTMMFIVLLSMSSYELLNSRSTVENQQQTIEALNEEIEPLRQLEMEGRSAIVLQHWQERVHQVLDSLKLKDDVALTLEDEFISLQIEDRMLFDSGNAQLKTTGQQILDNLLPVFELAAGTILIEGHTDNIPIDTTQFPSNWELGAARASNVVKYLASRGMPASRLRAISYADSKPVAANDTEEGRQKNRRVAMLLRMPDTVD